MEKDIDARAISAEQEAHLAQAPLELHLVIPVLSVEDGDHLYAEIKQLVTRYGTYIGGGLRETAAGRKERRGKTRKTQRS